MEVLFDPGFVRLLLDTLFLVFRPFPEGRMGRLAAVGVELLVASDLLDQVGQEEQECDRSLRLCPSYPAHPLWIGVREAGPPIRVQEARWRYPRALSMGNGLQRDG